MENLANVLTVLFTAGRFSLREQEQTVARLSIVLQTIPLNHYMFVLPLSVLLFLREWEPQTYRNFEERRVDADGLLERLEALPGLSQVFERHEGQLIEATILAGASEFKAPSNRLASYATTDKISQTAGRPNHIVNLVNSIRRESEAVLEETFRRIELAKPFVSPVEATDGS